MNFIKGISANYIVIKISEKRPSNIISAPDPGTYDKVIDVSFNVPKNSKVYYTIDGSAPTTSSKLYDANNPIRIEKGNVTIRAFAINDAGMISDEYSATYKIYNDNTPYLFVDEKMESIVRILISKAEGTITYRDLEGITVLNNEIKGGSIISGNIKKLDDLQAMNNLSSVILKNEPEIESFDPLLTIKTLSELELSACTIDDEDLKKISSIAWLEKLRLENNTISDITPLSSMIILKELSLSNNTIKDVETLVNLPNLNKLNISKNLISDLSSISQMPKLQVLDISENLINDVSVLSSLNLLTELNIGGNKIKILDGISRIPRITTLIISNNPISSLSPISEYSNLINLKADLTSISSLAELENITSLTTLNVSGTAVTDFSPLAGMKVENLTASNIGLTVISTIAGVNSLEMLELPNNNIVDVQPLTGLSKLTVLNLSGNSVYNLTVLADCASLETINASNSTVSDADAAILENSKITVIR
jgi:internalin A